jgi:PAS domain-containing protein
MSQEQRPLELILARNLITNLSTPAVLTDEEGVLLFFNDAAAELLGCDFEQASALGAALWERIGPFDDAGERVPAERLPLVIASRLGSPSHAQMRIHAFDGREHEIDVSALPILTSWGARGALAFFWPQPGTPG